MPRPRNWDERDVLDAVTKAFRERGYAGVSVRELESTTGLHATSLYKAYGNKEGLFSAALASYNAKVVEARVRKHLAREDAPLEGIREYFVSTFAPKAKRDPGCLLTNSAIESYAEGAFARTSVAEGLRTIQQGFEDALVRARHKKQVAPSVVPAEGALQLLALYQGVLVLVRFGMKTAELETLVDRALDALLRPMRRKGKR